MVKTLVKLSKFTDDSLIGRIPKAEKNKWRAGQPVIISSVDSFEDGGDNIDEKMKKANKNSKNIEVSPQYEKEL